VLSQVHKQKQAGVGKRIGHQDPLQKLQRDDADKQSWDVASHCITVKARYLDRGWNTSGKERRLHFMNLNIKKRMSGTPAPKLNTVVTAYLTNSSLKK